MVGKWQAHQDSNPGPLDLESSALPTELYAYMPQAYDFIALFLLLRQSGKRN